MFELAVLDEFGLIELVRLIFHFGQKNGDDVIEILEDELGNDLQHVFYNFDQLVGIELGDAFDIGTLGAQHPDHRNVQDGTQLHEGTFEQKGDAW